MICNLYKKNGGLFEEIKIIGCQNVIPQLRNDTMKYKWTLYQLAFWAATLISCGTGNQKETPAGKIEKTVMRDRSPKDTFGFKETFNQENIPANEYLAEKLKPIRVNFRRINSIANWTTIDTKGLSETTEGGEAKFYYLNGQLNKITTWQLGETFRLLTEYYLLNGQLSFVLERTYKYNRPFYYDSVAMKENNDTEVFDFKKSEIIEDRSYFENGKLLHHINNQDCGSPFSAEYLLQEQKRIIADFGKLREPNARE